MFSAFTDRLRAHVSERLSNAPAAGSFSSCSPLSPVVRASTVVIPPSSAVAVSRRVDVLASSLPPGGVADRLQRALSGLGGRSSSFSVTASSLVSCQPSESASTRVFFFFRYHWCK